MVKFICTCVVHTHSFSPAVPCSTLSCSGQQVEGRRRGQRRGGEERTIQGREDGRGSVHLQDLSLSQVRGATLLLIRAVLIIKFMFKVLDFTNHITCISTIPTEQHHNQQNMLYQHIMIITCSIHFIP